MIFLLTLDKTCWQKKWLEYRTIEHHYQTTWLNWHKRAALSKNSSIYILFQCTLDLYSGL